LNIRKWKRAKILAVNFVISRVREGLYLRSSPHFHSKTGQETFKNLKFVWEGDRVDTVKYRRQLSQHSDSVALSHQDLLQHATIRRVTTSIDIPHTGATSLQELISLLIKSLHLTCKRVFFQNFF